MGVLDIYGFEIFEVREMADQTASLQADYYKQTTQTQKRILPQAASMLCYLCRAYRHL